MPKPKRYLVFVCEMYYPAGGWADLEGSFDTLDEARVLARTCNDKSYQWADIIDLETGEEVE